LVPCDCDEAVFYPPAHRQSLPAQGVVEPIDLRHGLHPVPVERRMAWAAAERSAMVIRFLPTAHEASDADMAEHVASRLVGRGVAADARDLKHTVGVVVSGALPKALGYQAHAVCLCA